MTGLPALPALLGGLLAADSAAPVRVPAEITVQTPRGSAQFPVRMDPRAGPAVPGEPLLAALSGAVRPTDPWVEVTLARQTFRFLLGAPFYTFNEQLHTMTGWAFRSRDSLFLPIQFVTEILPRVLAERYSYDPATGRLHDTGPGPAARARLPNGLLPGHLVTIDPGHGGRDPGNPGYYFPRGIQEKHVTLEVGLKLRDELRRRGVKVVMTRTSDTLINLMDRAKYCTEECDLFVSLHVDALGPRARSRYGEIRGFHTIIIGEENTEDADRIAQMENDALRYEEDHALRPGDELDFILRNLQMNEYLRESARAAELVQDNLGQVHPGENRGVKQHNRLVVLNTARRPAILVEMGYATNQHDARLLVSRKAQQALATALADAIVAYLLEYERRSGVTDVGSGP
jgi:N-acetylmuramoyl-L-alanine amidase